MNNEIGWTFQYSELYISTYRFFIFSHSIFSIFFAGGEGIKNQRDPLAAEKKGSIVWTFSRAATKEFSRLTPDTFRFYVFPLA